MAGEPIASRKEFELAIDRGGFELVVTDYHLGWTDGVEVIRAVKSRYPGCPVIMLTGTGNEEVAVAAMKAGADDYVLKSPKHISLLATTVGRAMERAKQRRAATEAEKDLLAATDRAQRYLDVAEVILLALDERGTVTLINRKGCNILGYDEDELLGRDWFGTCVPDRMRDDTRRVFELMVRDGDEITIDIPNRKVDLQISESEMKKRSDKWSKPEPKIKTGYLSRYAKLVTSAGTGAVLDAQ